MSLNVGNCENAKLPRIAEITEMAGYESMKCCGVKDRWLRDWEVIGVKNNTV